MCAPPRIYLNIPGRYTTPFEQLYATLPESTPPPPRIYPFYNNYNIMRSYPSLPESTLFFSRFICATLPQSTPPSWNIPSFQQLYPALPESTPPSQTTTGHFSYFGMVFEGHITRVVRSPMLTIRPLVFISLF